MSKVRIKLNGAGVREVLKSSGAAEMCMSKARSAAASLGTGYIAESRKYPERTGAAVYADSYEAILDNLRHNSLLKAIGQ